MFGAFFAGFGLISEWRDGVIEAERVTPASRTALLMGRLWRDLLQLLVQALVLVGLGYWVGMEAPLRGVVLGVAAHPAGRWRLRGGLQRPGPDDQERGRHGPGHQRRDDAGAAALGHPAADDDRARLAAARPATSCRSAGSPTRCAARSSATSAPTPMMWGTVWAVGPVRHRPLVGHLDLPQGERLAPRSTRSAQRYAAWPSHAAYLCLRVVQAVRTGGALVEAHLPAPGLPDPHRAAVGARASGSPSRR